MLAKPNGILLVSVKNTKIFLKFVYVLRDTKLNYRLTEKMEDETVIEVVVTKYRPGTEIVSNDRNWSLTIFQILFIFGNGKLRQLITAKINFRWDIARLSRIRKYLSSSFMSPGTLLVSVKNTEIFLKFVYVLRDTRWNYLELDNYLEMAPYWFLLRMRKYSSSSFRSAWTRDAITVRRKKNGRLDFNRSCRNEISLMNGNCFKGSQLNLGNLLIFIYFWAWDFTTINYGEKYFWKGHCRVVNGNCCFLSRIRKYSSSRLCPLGHEMNFLFGGKNGRRDRYRSCRNEITLRNGNCLEGSQLNLDHFWIFVYFWAWEVLTINYSTK